MGMPHPGNPEWTGVMGYDVPSNIAITVLALLYGGDDFGKVQCIAVNCGEDTDCTAATAGSIWGIIHGAEAILQKWIDPIGRGIKTVCLNLGELGTFGDQVLRNCGRTHRPHGAHGVAFFFEQTRGETSAATNPPTCGIS